MPSLPIKVIATILLLAVATTALARTTWYVSGIGGSNSNN
jgi:hypothetical protein